MFYATEGTARAVLAALKGEEPTMPLGSGGYATEGTLRELAEAIGDAGGGGTELPDGEDGQVLKWSNGAWNPGIDNNTTYSSMSSAEAKAGVGRRSRVITAGLLATEIDRRVAAVVGPLEARVEALESEHEP